MSLWLVRAGSFGQHEAKFLNDSKIYLTWDYLEVDLSSFKSREELLQYLIENYETEKLNTVKNWSTQVWPFASRIQVDDWIVMPSKFSPVLFFGEITGPYHYNAQAEQLYQHSRTVKWFAKDIPRKALDQDLLYSMGAFMTICRITRNNAEERIKALYHNNWKSVALPRVPAAEADTENDTDESINPAIDLEQFAKDQIANHIGTKFQGHTMSYLVEAILKAKGYITYNSPEGPDKGVDILAAPEPMGFGNPRLCVQVKSGDTPCDRPTLDQLIGSMQNFHADQGLLVSWSGFKQSVLKEKPQQFFRVRLWDQEAIIKELLENYDKLDADIKGKLPLKQIWTLAGTE